MSDYVTREQAREDAQWEVTKCAWALMALIVLDFLLALSTAQARDIAIEKRLAAIETKLGIEAPKEPVK